MKTKKKRKSIYQSIRKPMIKGDKIIIDKKTKSKNKRNKNLDFDPLGVEDIYDY